MHPISTKADAPVTAPPNDPTPVDQTTSRKHRILVADDSADMRALLTDLLVDDGYEVTTASSGASALSIMSESPPDLLITDLLMPGMSGFALRSLMLRQPKLAAIRVVVLSAYWQRPSETLDVAAVLAKPLNIDRLLETVRLLTTIVGEPAGAPVFGDVG